MTHSKDNSAKKLPERDTGPELTVVEPEGPKRPFFDSEGTHISDLPVDKLDFEQFRRAVVDQEKFEPRPIIRYMIEASFGSVHDEQFEAHYAGVIGQLLEVADDPEKKSALDDTILALYDHFEVNAPRLIDVTMMLREREIVSAEESTTLMRMSFMVATQYA